MAEKKEDQGRSAPAPALPPAAEPVSPENLAAALRAITDCIATSDAAARAALESVEPNLAVLRNLAETIGGTDAAVEDAAEKITACDAAIRAAVEKIGETDAVMRAAQELGEPDLEALKALAEATVASTEAARQAIARIGDLSAVIKGITTAAAMVHAVPAEAEATALSAAVSVIDSIMSARTLDERIAESKGRADEAKRKAPVIAGYTTST
jgi:hypothetical protein